MSIDFQCACGKTLRAPEAAQGKRARCPRCGAISVVPASAPVPSAGQAPTDEYELKEMEPLRTPAAASTRLMPVVQAPARPTYKAAAPSSPSLSISRPGVRRFSYLLLPLLLIPLILSAFQPHENIGDKIAQTVAAHPEVADQLKPFVDANGDLVVAEDHENQFFAAFPNDRLEGALLAHESQAHWLLALGFAGAYLAFLIVAFPLAARHFKGLLFAGIFTGTAGIILLLIFQFAAFHMPLIIPRGIISLVFLIIKLIGYSYSLADDPNNGFLLSFIGFTCGVGLCEEVTKAIPLLFRIKPTPGEDDPTWNSLFLWGLASGIGFGIAEGIMYSGHYYNGIEGPQMYLVRFLSCVVLHAMWAGAVGISVYRRQGDLLGAGDHWTYSFRVVQIVAIPMVLHGLYDTLLKKEHDGPALVVAVATFAWLAYQIETQRRREPAALAV